MYTWQCSPTTTRNTPPPSNFLLLKCHINIRGRAGPSVETCSIWQPLISVRQVFSEALRSPKNYPLPCTTDKIICLAVHPGRKGWFWEKVTKKGDCIFERTDKRGKRNESAGAKEEHAIEWELFLNFGIWWQKSGVCTCLTAKWGAGTDPLLLPFRHLSAQCVSSTAWLSKPHT